MGLVNAQTRKEMFNRICALIPEKVSNQNVLKAFEMMRKEQKLLGKDFSGNASANEISIKKHLDSIAKARGYIEDQENYIDVFYGDSNIKYAGCEIVAAYNAMISLAGKEIMTLPQMISHFENDGMVYSGKFGTAPKSIADFFKLQGYSTNITTVEKRFNELGRNCRTLILTMYNDGHDVRQEVHTINISKEKGRFYAHNVYGDGTVIGPFYSVSQVVKSIHNGRAKGIALIGINETEDK